MITAEEARSLNPRQKETDLIQLEKLIRHAAVHGKTFIRVPGGYVRNKGYHTRFKAEGLEKSLVDAGFKIKRRSEARQFMDLWIEIHWGEEE
jgi:hypothetical protein